MTELEKILIKSKEKARSKEKGYENKIQITLEENNYSWFGKLKKPDKHIVANLALKMLYEKYSDVIHRILQHYEGIKTDYSKQETTSTEDLDGKIKSILGEW